MDWFKLDCDYGNDDRICELARLIGGDQARAFWPQLLGFMYANVSKESVSVKIVRDRSPDRSIGERSLNDLARFLNCHRNVTEIRLNHLANVSLISPTHWRNNSEIYIPKMLKRLGKHEVRPKDDAGSVQKTTPTDIKILDIKIGKIEDPSPEKRDKSDLVLTKRDDLDDRPFALQPPRPKDEKDGSGAAAALLLLLSGAFETSWLRYPHKDGKKEARRHYMASVKSEADAKACDDALTRYMAWVKLQRSTGHDQGFRQGKTWFHNWADWSWAQRSGWTWDPVGEQWYGGKTQSNGNTAFMGSDFKNDPFAGKLMNTIPWDEEVGRGK